MQNIPHPGQAAAIQPKICNRIASINVVTNVWQSARKEALLHTGVRDRCSSSRIPSTWSAVYGEALALRSRSHFPEIVKCDSLLHRVRLVGSMWCDDAKWMLPHQAVVGLLTNTRHENSRWHRWGLEWAIVDKMSWIKREIGSCVMPEIACTPYAWYILKSRCFGIGVARDQQSSVADLSWSRWKVLVDFYIPLFS